MPRVLLFTGDGKGKTTAALGMALRACGHGQRVLVVQFVKKDDTGELHADVPGLEVRQTGLGFVFDRSSPHHAEHRAAAQGGLRGAAEAMASGNFDVVVLDEVCVAVAEGLLDERQVCKAVASASPSCCIVLTGRGATQALLDLADTVTEMRCVKHGFDAGIPAQKGVEF